MFANRNWFIPNPFKLFFGSGGSSDAVLEQSAANKIKCTGAFNVTGVHSVDNADGLTVGGIIVPQKFIVDVQQLPADVDKWAFVADRAYTVTAIREVHSVAGAGSSTLGVRKVTAAATAPGAAAGATVIEMLSAAFALDSTADTTVNGSLSAVAGALNLAAGDKIGLDYGGTITNLKGLVQIELKAI